MVYDNKANKSRQIVLLFIVTLLLCMALAGLGTPMFRTTIFCFVLLVIWFSVRLWRTKIWVEDQVLHVKSLAGHQKFPFNEVKKIHAVAQGNSRQSFYVPQIILRDKTVHTYASLAERHDDDTLVLPGFCATVQTQLKVAKPKKKPKSQAHSLIS